MTKAEWRTAQEWVKTPEDPGGDNRRHFVEGALVLARFASQGTRECTEDSDD